MSAPIAAIRSRSTESASSRSTAPVSSPSAKEYVGSSFVLDVASDERAQEIARSYPALRCGERGGLELWPLMKGRPGRMAG